MLSYYHMLAFSLRYQRVRMQRTGSGDVNWMYFKLCVKKGVGDNSRFYSSPPPLIFLWNLFRNPFMQVYLFGRSTKCSCIGTCSIHLTWNILLFEIMLNVSISLMIWRFVCFHIHTSIRYIYLYTQTVLTRIVTITFFFSECVNSFYYG